MTIGLQKGVRALWESVHEVFDFSKEPGKSHVLAQA